MAKKARWHLAKWSQFKERPVELDVDLYEHDDKQPGGRPLSVYHERLFIAYFHPIQSAQSENH